MMRICFLGESFVNGTGDPEFLGWTGRLCQTANQYGTDITYYNLGIRRETSTELKQRWYMEVKRRLPSKGDGRVVFCFGVNDTTQEGDRLRVELPDSLENAYHILSKARQEYPVLMVSPLPIADVEQNLRIAYLAQEMSSLCQELKIPYFNAFTPLKNSLVWQQEVKNGDGAHPGAGGYTELAELVQNWFAWREWVNHLKV